MEMIKTLKNNPLVVFLGCLFILSMVVGYKLNINTTHESEKKIAEIKRTNDSTQKILSDELKFTLDQNKILKEEIKQAKNDSIRLKNEIKSLRKVVKIYLSVKNNADSIALKNLDRLLTELENRQRERAQNK